MVARSRHLGRRGGGEPVDGHAPNPRKAIRLGRKANRVAEGLCVLQNQANVQLLLREEHEGSAHPPANKLARRDLGVQSLRQTA